MFDVEKRNDMPSTSSLAKLGIAAIGYTAGGVFLMLLQVFSRARVFGLIIGAIVCIIGIVSIQAKDPADRKVGAVITAAGALTLLAKSGIPVITHVSGTLLGIGTVGLLAMGVLSGIKFLIGLSKRS
jgi:hypothetical protein